jgi:hypothetical protein
MPKFDKNPSPDGFFGHGSSYLDSSLDIRPKNTEIREKAQRGTEKALFWFFLP